MKTFVAVMSVLGLGLVACEESSDSSTDASVGDAATVDGGDDGSASLTCEPREVPCVDNSIDTLDLFDTVAPEEITEEGTDPNTFSTLIDTTGGGFMPSHAYVYARFTESGLEKVAIDDEAAFDSTEWDIAFRRFVIRLNSGVSGPSCVTVGRTAPGTTFADLASVPDNLTYRTEEYFTETCEYVPDGSGIMSPGTALSSYWTYTDCVKMTHNVYVIALASGRHVKFEVLSYYAPANQDSCDNDEGLPMPSGAGETRIRWAFLD